MAELSVQELVQKIGQLKKMGPIAYPTGNSTVSVDAVELPEGPIWIIREGKKVSISTDMLQRYVNAINTRKPVQIDRVLGASYNTRSALEALVAACPNFFMCTPERLEITPSTTLFKKGHKHLIWLPDREHALGKFEKIEISGYVTETPSIDYFIEVQNVPLDPSQEKPEQRGTAEERIHWVMQALLVQSALNLGYKPWLAVQDHGLEIDGKRVLDMADVVKDVSTEPCISNYHRAVKVARDIDCLWFNGGMPFAFEVEHTTGVYSGLDRMNRLHDAIRLETDFVIVAKDEDRKKVLSRAQSSQYSDLRLWYMPYSQVDELAQFTHRHRYRGIPNQRPNFVRMFMEEITL